MQSLDTCLKKYN